jgi:hypothetical protein
VLRLPAMAKCACGLPEWFAKVQHNS